MLVINGISKAFKDVKVLDNLSLKVDDASVFGLVGVNGAGKSTLLRSIAGIYHLDAGNISFNGEDTYANPLIRKDIFLVADDLYYPFAATIKSLKNFYGQFYALDEEAYAKYLKLFRLDPLKPIANFSKGMKRQVALVFALAIKPKLLLLDEAFDGLDLLVRYTFKKTLTDLLEDQSCSVIISSHNLKELENICDSYGILEDGKIEDYGNLMENKAHINKYQMAFNEDKRAEDFADFELLHFNKLGKVITLVIKGDPEDVYHRLKAYNPLILDVLNVSFEELFIYEIEKKEGRYE